MSGAAVLLWIGLAVTLSETWSEEVQVSSHCDANVELTCGDAWSRFRNGLCQPEMVGLKKIIDVQLNTGFSHRYCRRNNSNMFGIGANGTTIWVSNWCYGTFNVCIELEQSIVTAENETDGVTTTAPNSNEQTYDYADSVTAHSSTGASNNNGLEKSRSTTESSNTLFQAPGIIVTGAHHDKTNSNDSTTTSPVSQGAHDVTADNNTTMDPVLKSPPRPLDTEYNKTYHRAVNDNVTLSIEFIAYPPPTTYRWYKLQSDNKWTEITVGQSSAADHANLTIENIKEEDFGQYRVDIVNSVGPMKHLFFVAAQVNPDAPVSFSMMTSLKAPTFFWISGYNGGYEQTFVIEVSPIERNEWAEKLAIVEGDRRYMLPSGNYIADIDELNPGTYRARIRSQNVRERSKYSEFLSSFSVSASSFALEPEKQVSAGAIAGGVVAGIEAIVIVVIVTIVFILRQRSKKDSDKMTKYCAEKVELEETRTSTQQYYSIGANAASAGSIEEAQPNVYEKLDPELNMDGVYDEVETNNKRRQENTSPEYVNLNLKV